MSAQTVTLSHGRPDGSRSYEVTAPLLGLGVWQAQSGGSAKQAVLWALEAGYRHIDTAAAYRNENDVGAAISAADLDRKDIFVTTKLWPGGQDAKGVVKSCDESLNKLGLESVDLYLVHSPPTKKKRAETWKGMEEVLTSGRARSIGVSNYGIHHLEALFEQAEYRPAANQMELSPYLRRAELVAFCANNGIAMTAYSPITRGERLGDAALAEVASHYGKTTAQVLIRWSAQMGYIVIPKSVRQERIVENGAIWDFELSAADMTTMSGWDENYMTCWDPASGP